MRFALFLAAALAVTSGAVSFPVAAHAADKDEPRQLALFQNWGAYRVLEDGNKVCYMSSQPKSSTPKAEHRGDAYASVTFRPSDHARNVFNFTAGYTYKPHADVVLTIDGQHFPLFTKGDSAWAQDNATDDKIANALRRGKAMTVTGTSSHDTKTTDTFDLAGAKSAYQAIQKECKD